MKIIDFIFYYLIKWFEKRQQKFKRIDPIEKTCYGLGISVLLWLMCFDMVVEYFVLKSFKSIIPNYVFVIVAIFFMWLFKYIYITKGRYKSVLETNEDGFNVSEKTGITISIIFVFLSLFIPMALAVLLHKIDGSL
jgi:hypothetical protein